MGSEDRGWQRVKVEGGRDRRVKVERGWQRVKVEGGRDWRVKVEGGREQGVKVESRVEERNSRAEA